MKVTLITAYYKNEELTKEFLDNLKDKLTIDTEVIVVNAESKPIEHPLITKRVDLEENKGFSNSMNAGLKEATGDYIIIIGNDGFPKDEHWIEELIRIEQLTKAGIVAPEASKPHFKAITRNDNSHNKKENYSIVNFYPAICWMITKETLKEVGLFDEEYGIGTYEDNDYIQRLKLSSKPLVVVSHKYILEHRLSKTFGLFKNSSSIMSKNFKLYKEKWKI